MSLRRGACPSLSQPMQTGDGLLVRLNPSEGKLTGHQLAGLARAAGRFGNGILEITARGSLQLRGLTMESMAGLGATVEALGIEARSRLPVDIGPLAGVDRDEIADPRPLAWEIWSRCEAMGLSARLGPKVSVTVDGGGALGLGGSIADVKLEAVAKDSGVPDSSSIVWLLRIGGTSATARVLGRFPEAEAAETTICILAALAERGDAARARDLSDADLVALTDREPTAGTVPARPARRPVGRFALRDGAFARGLALAYGQIPSAALAAFAEAVGEDREIRLARGRGLIVLDVSAEEDAALLSSARRLGLVASPADPRLSIAACAGKPACASAHLATRRLAERLVQRRPGLLDGSFTLHLSGCEKECARPSGPAVTLIGGEAGHEVHAEGCIPSPDLEAALSALAEEELRHKT